MSVFLTVIAITGCEPASPGTTSEPVNNLKLGVLPLVSALPIFVAEQEGYFDAEGLNVELVTFNSALEQDAAFQAKQIDGYFSDPINAIVMISGGVDMAIVNTPYRANAADRMFAILVNPNSEIDTVEKLKGVEVGIASATITEYLQEQILLSRGLSLEDIKGQDVRQIPIRLQLLLASQLEAAVLPETLVTLAEQGGARVIADDTVLALSETVVALNNGLMERDGTLKRRFLSSLRKAAEKLNGETADYARPLLANINVPPDVRAVYEVPDFAVDAVPSDKELTDIQDWLISKGVIRDRLPYSAIVK
jgi:NitT/TauT family transport system substrate-binding protein